MILIKNLTNKQVYNICLSSRCNNCELNLKNWCVFKNTHEQMENSLGKKTFEKYMNKEITLNE